MTGGPVAGRYTRSASTDESSDWHDVALLGLPLALFLRTRQHHDELLRELTLLALAHDDQTAHHSLSGRLAALVEALGRRYGTPASRADAVRDAAIERGDATADLSYRVPSSIAADLTMLQDMLDAADELCRSGELLTLPRDDVMVSFSHWYSDEFARQLDGLPPRRWTGPLT